MSIDAWILALPSEWDSLGDFSYTHSQAITGYWKSSGSHEVYNVVGSEADIQLILDELPSTDTIYSWVQGPGYDNLEQWPIDPAPILALMADRFDGSGNPIPATLENPNWGHVFFGQSDRIFAGTFSAAFSGAFL